MMQLHYLTPDQQSWVLYQPGWLPSKPETFVQISNERPVERHVIKMFGKPTPLPRYNQSYGADYRFSGAVAPGKPMTPLIDAVRQKMISDLKPVLPGVPVEFNMCLVNWYPDGTQFIGPHSDDERQMVPNSPVGTLSWGSSRTFILEPKKGVEGSHLQLRVNDGDLLVMGGRTQLTHKHSVPKEGLPLRGVAKEAGVNGMRVSFTFRMFHPIYVTSPGVGGDTVREAYRSGAPCPHNPLAVTGVVGDRELEQRVQVERRKEIVGTVFTKDEMELMLRKGIKDDVRRNALVSRMNLILTGDLFSARDKVRVLRELMV